MAIVHFWKIRFFSRTVKVYVPGAKERYGQYVSETIVTTKSQVFITLQLEFILLTKLFSI